MCRVLFGVRSLFIVSCLLVGDCCLLFVFDAWYVLCVVVCCLCFCCSVLLVFFVLDCCLVVVCCCLLGIC